MMVDASLSAVRDDFNAHADQWRVVLLVSPTCSECILGARAVEREIMARYPDQSVHATVVWVKMLDRDSEETARGSSGIIGRANASHFYDGAQATGRAYARGPFADMGAHAKASPPEGDWLLEDWPRHREDAPQWDLYMLYAPGVKWDGAGTEPSVRPVPTAWIRHLGRHSGGRSVYWRDTPDKPPREGNLFEAMREMAGQTIGTPMNGPGEHVGALGAPRIELLGFPGCPNTPTMRANLGVALESMGKGWSFVEVDQESLAEGDLRRGYPTPTVLVNGRDLYGLPVPGAASMGCRLYPGGLPDAKELAERLRGAGGG